MANASEALLIGSLDYFQWDRMNVLIVVSCLLGLLLYFIFSARSGKELFIRRMSGLSAIEDAVGRATEMGRGVLYIPGINDIKDIQTLSGITILSHVARQTAELQTPLFCPIRYPFTMTVAQEVVRQAYIEKNRLEFYRSDRINYLTADQFGYVAGVSGLISREKPAACFYLGAFFAESLILAETGFAAGAIQIAGTAEVDQLPFFVVACDYTLIGEELFAASAYLSRNPKEVGALKGQDVSKGFIILAILVGCALMTLAQLPIGKQYPSVKGIGERFAGFFQAK